MFSLRQFYLLMIGTCLHVQTVTIQSTNDSALEDSSNTIDLYSQISLSPCTSSSNCSQHSWCNAGKCECEHGWITWCHSEPCSYKQLSKPFSLAISILLGVTGADWFYLSRQDNLYISVGILKCLMLIASDIWRRLTVVSDSKPAKRFALSLSVTLGLIVISWWSIDCYRIVFDSFPDGYGAPLAS